MIRARTLRRIALVLEADNVGEHGFQLWREPQAYYISSPSMSSSAASTTTLWISMRNQYLKVARSRFSGQADSSSVQVESWNSKSQEKLSSTHSCRSSSCSNSGSRYAVP